MSYLDLPIAWERVPIEDYGVGGCASKLPMSSLGDYYSAHTLSTYGGFSQIILGVWHYCHLYRTTKTRWIPDTVNNIVVMCDVCDKPVVRIRGFIDHEWKMELPV